MATSNAEAPTTSNAGQINIKVKTLGQASYDLEVAADVRLLCFRRESTLTVLASEGCSDSRSPTRSCPRGPVQGCHLVMKSFCLTARPPENALSLEKTLSMKVPQPLHDSDVPGLALQALVSEVKAQLARASSTPANLQRLVFRGRVLKDEQRLSQYSARACTPQPALPARRTLCTREPHPRAVLRRVACKAHVHACMHRPWCGSHALKHSYTWGLRRESAVTTTGCMHAGVGAGAVIHLVTRPVDVTQPPPPASPVGGATDRWSVHGGAGGTGHFHPGAGPFHGGMPPGMEMSDIGSVGRPASAVSFSCASLSSKWELCASCMADPGVGLG